MRKILLAATVVLLTSACGILYRQPIYQGNLIDGEAVQQLAEGQTKQQVIALLGSPSIADPFHAQRWDYTATERTGRTGRTEVKNLTLHFQDDRLARWEGEYFEEDNLALSQRMRRFGNLPRENERNRRR